MTTEEKWKQYTSYNFSVILGPIWGSMGCFFCNDSVTYSVGQPLLVLIDGKPYPVCAYCGYHCCPQLAELAYPGRVRL